MDIYLSIFLKQSPVNGECTIREYQLVTAYSYEAEA